MGQILTFDEATHTYRVDGRVVPSVTQIIKAVFPNVYANIPAAILDRKARLGTAVHKAVELWLGHSLDVDTLHEEVKPYLASWMQWWMSIDVETGWSTEQKLYSTSGYAMTRDFFGVVDGALTLIDWKITGTKVPTHDIQIAGYAHGGPTTPDVAGCLYLKSDGSKAEFVETSLTRALPNWLATLRVYNLMEKMK